MAPYMAITRQHQYAEDCASQVDTLRILIRHSIEQCQRGTGSELREGTFLEMLRYGACTFDRYGLASEIWRLCHLRTRFQIAFQLQPGIL